MNQFVAFDRRTTAARRDLAAAHLRGQVEAERFVEGRRRTVLAASTPLRPEPRADQGIDTELLRGEVFTVYETDLEGWSWGQAETDAYVGWLPSEALSAGEPEAPTHKIGALRSFIYPGPDIKLPVSGALPFGARVAVRDKVGAFAAIDEGFLWAGHLRPVGDYEADAVDIAKRFLGVPYLWGGKTAFGLDCSGLVQTALAATGRAAPRDSDMQEREVGVAIDPDGPLERGDLVFWKGHVGILRNATTLLHANGYSMTVASEPLADARVRILSAGGGAMRTARRL